MKRCAALSVIVSLALTLVIGVCVAAAGRDSSHRSGNRATREEEQPPRPPSGEGRSWSAPPQEDPAPVPPQKPVTWRRLVRRALTGGLIGSLIFGRRFTGIGALDVVVLSGLIVLAYRFLSRYQAGQSAEQYVTAGAPSGGAVFLPSTPAPVAAENGRDALERAADAIRQADPSFDPAAFASVVGDIFQRVQAAWTARDIAKADDVLTPNMRERLEREVARLTSAGRVNRVERITVRRVAIVAARQERGWDRVAVQIDASLVDYTTDQVGLKVLEGNPFEPVPFSERWDLVRPTGPHGWRVNAIE